MVNELTKEQQAKFGDYVEKWISIGVNTEPIDFDAVVVSIKNAYKNANLKTPKYFFKVASPMSAIHAIFIVDSLSTLKDNYFIENTDCTIYSDVSKWINVFNSIYEQYSAQYKKIKWNEDVKNRMISYISKCYTSDNVHDKMSSYFNSFLYGGHDSAWLSFYDYFWEEFKMDCIKELFPFFEIAKNCGWWSAYENVVFVQDRHAEVVFGDNGVLHNLNGPAIKYADYEVYCIDGHWFPEYVVMDPNKITISEIEKEENAEKRRILLSQYGYERYFQNAKCEVIDQDMVQVAINDSRTMPRMLIKTKNDDLFLVGTDGSTERVYVMPILRGTTTCKAAHELISGMDEDKCLAQS